MLLIKKSKEIFGRKYYECKKHVLRKECSKNVLCHEEKKSFSKVRLKKIEGKIYWITNFLGKQLSMLILIMSNPIKIALLLLLNSD